MSGGGGTQTVTQKTEIPEWVQAAGQQNLAAAYDVANNMLGPYEGQRVAAMSPAQLATIQGITANAGMAQPAYAYAQQMAANYGNYQPQQVTAAQLSEADLSPYMNPYTQNVIDTSLSALNTQRMMGLNQASDAAARAKAFGGSRQAIQEGVVNASAQQQAGQLAANLYNQNFMQAQAAASGDIQRQMMAQQLNQAAGLQGAQLGLSGAGLLGQLAGAGQQSYLTGMGAALAGQTAIQQQQQAELDAARQYYAEQQQFPLQQLQIPLQALGITPYGQSSTQTGPGPSSNPLMTALGAGSSLASIIGFLSDKSMKTDIEKLGKDKETGLDMYAYRYKGDPKTYPKVVGPMAQDIKKKYPDAVEEKGGKLAVKFPSMLGGMS